jgi:hypothetical protein
MRLIDDGQRREDVAAHFNVDRTTLYRALTAQLTMLMDHFPVSPTYRSKFDMCRLRLSSVLESEW